MIDSIEFRALAGLTLLLGTACSAMRNCPAGQDEPIAIDHGISDATTLSYVSAPWGGTLDAFPAKTRLRFTHELGVIPLDVKAYLAFDQTGTNDAGPGSVAESAGNQDLIDCVDAHVIEVKNDTCEDGFYIRLTASGEMPTDPDGPDLSNVCSE